MSEVPGMLLGSALQGGSHHPEALASALPLSFGKVPGTRGFPGPWEKSGGWPNILKGETGRRR